MKEKYRKIKNNTAILYNPDRIGRGIHFDGRKAQEGFYVVSYNIPTTRARGCILMNVLWKS